MTLPQEPSWSVTSSPLPEEVVLQASILINDGLSSYILPCRTTADTVLVISRSVSGSPFARGVIVIAADLPLNAMLIRVLSPAGYIRVAVAVRTARPAPRDLRHSVRNEIKNLKRKQHGTCMLHK